MRFARVVHARISRTDGRGEAVRGEKHGAAIFQDRTEVDNGWIRRWERGRRRKRRRWMALASVSWRGYRSFVRRFNFSWRARPRHRHPRRWMPRRYLAGVVTSQSFYIHPASHPRLVAGLLPTGSSRPLYSAPLKFSRFPRLPPDCGLFPPILIPVMATVPTRPSRVLRVLTEAVRYRCSRTRSNLIIN